MTSLVLPQQQDTVFTVDTHPTYKKDLDIVSKIMPVASYTSLSTLAPTSESASSDIDDVSEKGYTAVSEKVTKRGELVLKREALVKALGSGHDYKIEKLMALERKNAMDHEIVGIDEMFWATRDYDSADIGCNNEMEKKAMTELVMKRQSLIQRISAGRDYREEKKLALENKRKNKDMAVVCSDAEMYWAHRDYETEF